MCNRGRNRRESDIRVVEIGLVGRAPELGDQVEVAGILFYSLILRHTPAHDPLGSTADNAMRARTRASPLNAGEPLAHAGPPDHTSWQNECPVPRVQHPANSFNRAYPTQDSGPFKAKERFTSR
jgi:hypothetical protein